MRIDAIKLNPQVQKKIYEKHSLLSKEIALILKDGNTIFKKVGGNQIMAVGCCSRYITIFFRHNPKRKEAVIAAAYTSGKKQIKYYKKAVK